ncbi:MAG: hypothetical protein U9Q00_10350 [Synergistota bacterium]|nr:hypothetical protein [Synergistota bacterium]
MTERDKNQPIVSISIDSSYSYSFTDGQWRYYASGLSSHGNPSSGPAAVG